MNVEALCPRCHAPLPAADEDGCRRCDGCAGMFLPVGAIRAGLLDEAADAVAAEATSHAVPPDASPSLVCPGCGQPMRAVPLAGFVIDRCSGCAGVWVDAGEDVAVCRPAEAPAAFNRYLLYSLTLPERSVRGTIGLAAGTARELAELVVPRSFQSARTYELVVRNSLRFLTEDVAGVTPAPGTGQRDTGDFVARKAVGNFVDLAGLATLHVSPLWLLAVVSDVAYGSRAYVQELAQELKRQGVIDESSTIHRVDDVLEAVRNASGQAAELFDTPPLSIEQLKASLENTRSAVASADYRRVLPEAEIRRYWSEMREVAAREGVSLIGVSGALTMHSLQKVSTVSRGALTGVQVVGGLFSRHVIGHYVDSLAVIRERGFYQTVRESYAPYVDALWRNFASDRSTWTEELVTGRAFAKALRTVTRWFRRR